MFPIRIRVYLLLFQDDVVDLCVESSFPELDEEEIDESNGEEEAEEEEEEEEDDEGGRLEMNLAETGSIIHIVSPQS